MGTCFLYGNGGSGEKDRLRLRVLGGMTAPANPQENDIWVQTDVAISGWEFSEPQSLTWTMKTGFVYFASTYPGAYAARNTTGLNFLNQNTIYTKLLRCDQYNGSVWSRKNAYIYHASTGWNQFSTELWLIYHSGVALTTNYTGGFEALAYKSSTSGSTEKAPGMELGATLKLSLTGTNAYNMGAVFTKSPIDLTNWKTLVLDVEAVQVGGAYGGFDVSLTPTKQNKFVQTAKVSVTNSGNVTLDVSGRSGSYYLALSLGGVAQGYTCYASIYNIYLM